MSELFHRLETIFEELTKPGISVDEVMNIRFEIGYILNRCALIDPIKTIEYLFLQMREISPSENISLILIASIAFTYNFLPNSSKYTDFLGNYQNYMEHMTFRNDSHLIDLGTYIEKSNCKNILFIEHIINDFIRYIPEKSKVNNKIIACLINSDPIKLSPILWSQSNELRTSDLMFFLGFSVVSYSIYPPDSNDPKFQIIIQQSKATIKNSTSFNELEISLNIIRWCVKHKLFIPDFIELNNPNPSLNELAIYVWVEYSVYGDITIIPKLEPKKSSIETRAYSYFLSCVLKNPSYDINQLEIPHSMYNSIRNHDAEHPLLLSLSLEELMNLQTICNYLPAWFFIHCLRFRKNDTDYHQCIIYIISFIPEVILNDHFQEFIDFILFSLKFQNENTLQKLFSMIQNLSASIIDKIDVIAHQIINDIDFFDDINLSSHLSFLSVLNSFVAIEENLMVFDQLWEAIPIIRMSLPLLVSIYNFCESLALRIFNETEKLIILGMSALLVLFKEENIQLYNDSPQFQTCYASISKFYSLFRADIISEPNYVLSDSFPVLKNSIKFLSDLVLSYNTLSIIIPRLHILHSICPDETLCFMMKALPYLSFFQLGKCLKNFNDLVLRKMNHRPSEVYKIFASLFHQDMKLMFDIEIKSIDYPGTIELYDDPQITREMMKYELSLIPLLITKPKQLFLLNEDWYTSPDEYLIKEIKFKLSQPIDWETERYFRNFLKYFKLDQPPLINKGWLEYDFGDKKISKKSILDFDVTENLEENIKILKSNYPVPNIDDRQTLIVECSKMFINDKKVVAFLRKCMDLCRETISPFLGSCEEAAIISCSVIPPIPITEPYDIVPVLICARQGHHSDEYIKDILEIEHNIRSQKMPCSDILSKYKSETLAGFFIDESVTEKMMKKFLLSPVPSIRIKSLSMLPYLVKTKFNDEFNIPAKSLKKLIDPLIPQTMELIYKLIYYSRYFANGRFKNSLNEVIHQAVSIDLSHESVLLQNILSNSNDNDDFFVQSNVMQCLDNEFDAIMIQIT